MRLNTNSGQGKLCRSNCCPSRRGFSTAKREHISASPTAISWEHGRGSRQAPQQLLDDNGPTPPTYAAASFWGGRTSREVSEKPQDAGCASSGRLRVSCVASVDGVSVEAEAGTGEAKKLISPTLPRFR